MAKKDTYQLLKQWLRGAAGYREEQALGRQAERDDFLADAMDGYSALPGGAHAERVQRLKQRLREQTRRKRRTPAYWLRVAAAVLLIGFAGGAFWYLNQPLEGPLTERTSTTEEEKKGDDIENMGEARPDTAGQSTEAITARKKSAPARAEAAPSEPSAARKMTKPPSSEAPAPTAQLPPASPELPTEEAKEDMLAEDRLESESLPVEAQRKPALESEEMGRPAFDDTSGHIGQSAGREDSETPASVAEEIESEEIAMQEKKAAPPPTAYHFDSLRGEQKGDEGEDSFVLQGKVVEQATGEPIIAANVLIVGSKEGAITDLDGNFSLEISGDSAEIMVDYVGFQSYNLMVQRGDTVEIRLPESDMALEEVVVTSQGISRRSKAKAQRLPKPVDGWQKFRRYVRQNLRYPESASQASIRGEVELSFDIDSKGRPVDIKVEKSLAYGCDEEAIRLLRDGPDWEVGKGRGAYTFKFP